MQLKELMELCINLSNKVTDLENKVIEMKSSHQAKFAELESRVEKLEEENISLTNELKSFNIRVESPSIKETVVDKEESSKQGRKITDIDADAEVKLENVYNFDMAHEETVLSMQDVNVQSERIENVVKEVAKEMVEVMEIAKIISDEVSTTGGELNAANEKPVSAAPTNITTTQPSEVTKTTVDIATAPNDKGIVFHDKKELTTITASSKSQAKYKGKAKLVDEPKIQKSRKVQIAIDEEVQSRQSYAVRKYQALKRKPVSVAQARKNMMIYLKNMVGFKIDFFNGMSYEEIRPLFEEEYNKVQTLFKEGLEMDAEMIKAPRKRTRKEKVEKYQTVKKQKIVPDDEDDVFVNVTPLSFKPLTIVDYKIYKEGKKEHLQIFRANGRFKKSQPKEVLDFFLWHTLKVMIEHIVEDSVWKHQKGPQGVARVKNWKLFYSCRVHCVTLETIQLFLLAEKMYPLTNYILQQIYNEVRLHVNYEVEMAYDLLRLVRKQLREGYVS
nr:hypothetical protein [Tanacetum cinerariifolium]